MGKMYGQLEIKIVFLSSIALFKAASVICGAVPSRNVLIVGRVICGLGGSGIYLGCMNIHINVEIHVHGNDY